MTKQNEVRFLTRKLFLDTNIYFEAYISPERQWKIHLRQMLRHYEQWRRLVKFRENWSNTVTEKESIDEFERYIVHYLLAVCFWTSCEDSDTVSNLLSILFNKDEHFEEMFGTRPIRSLDLKKYSLEDLDTTKRYSWIYSTKWGDLPVDYFEQKEQQINYFIKHGFKEKLFFLRFGEHWLRHKLIDVPDYSTYSQLESVFFTHPDELAKFLEHGLFSNANERDESVGKLLKLVFLIWFTEGLRDEYPLSTHYKRKAKALEVAAMLLRTVKCVDISSMRIPLSCERLRLYVGELSKDILPMMKTRCIGPQKLQHLCRWEVRKRMCECRQLPDGIYRLPIPKSLHQYLGLKCDESDVTFSKLTYKRMC